MFCFIYAWDLLFRKCMTVYRNILTVDNTSYFKQKNIKDPLQKAQYLRIGRKTW